MIEVGPHGRVRLGDGPDEVVESEGPSPVPLPHQGEELGHLRPPHQPLDGDRDQVALVDQHIDSLLGRHRVDTREGELRAPFLQAHWEELVPTEAERRRPHEAVQHPEREVLLTRDPAGLQPMSGSDGAAAVC